ncbi:hypothetical protein PIECOFPK_02794 [Mycovorax composti]|uniref:Uncharacterized protein n=1 Tax=Mycovorax composti TaxID=2962693 RepID=A0ABZ2EP74_9BACT
MDRILQVFYYPIDLLPIKNGSLRDRATFNNIFLIIP